jgi:hypothetical protein
MVGKRIDAFTPYVAIGQANITEAMPKTDWPGKQTVFQTILDNNMGGGQPFVDFINLMTLRKLSCLFLSLGCLFTGSLSAQADLAVVMGARHAGLNLTARQVSDIYLGHARIHGTRHSANLSD